MNLSPLLVLLKTLIFCMGKVLELKLLVIEVSQIRGVYYCVLCRTCNGASNVVRASLYEYHFSERFFRSKAAMFLGCTGEKQFSFLPPSS